MTTFADRPRAAAARDGDRAYRFAFVLDQQVGLRTQALNLERAVADDPSVDAAFVAVEYAATVGVGALAFLPGVPVGVRGTLRGVREIQKGLAAAGRRDAVLWATWAAKAVPDLVAAAPALLRMDMTPVQMEAMGAEYGYHRARAGFLRGMKRRATDRLYRAVARHLPWSGYVADSLRADYGVPAAKIEVISPGVDTHLFRPDPSAKSADGTVRLLFVGGDFARKGGDLLLRWAASRRGRAGLPPFELHLVTRAGDEVVRTDVAAGVHVHRDIGNNSPELVRLYQSADLFVLPTRADCYSLVGLEAMASGLPVVISRLGGIPDLVADGGTGRLLPPGDYDALAAALDALVADSGMRAAMGAAARRRAEERFEIGACLGRVLRAMKEAAG